MAGLQFNCGAYDHARNGSLVECLITLLPAVGYSSVFFLVATQRASLIHAMYSVQSTGGKDVHIGLEFDIAGC